MSATPGVICGECLGRIDEQAFDMARKMAAKLSRPFRTPRVCSECAVTAMLRFAFSDDDGAGAVS